MRRLLRHDATCLATRLGRSGEEFASELTLRQPRGGDVVCLPGGEGIEFNRSEVNAISDRNQFYQPRLP